MQVIERLEGPPPSPPNREGLFWGRGETEESKRKHRKWEMFMVEWRLYHELKRVAN